MDDYAKRYADNAFASQTVSGCANNIIVGSLSPKDREIDRVIRKFEEITNRLCGAVESIDKRTISVQCISPEKNSAVPDGVKAVIGTAPLAKKIEQLAEIVESQCVIIEDLERRIQL